LYKIDPFLRGSHLAFAFHYVYLFLLWAMPIFIAVSKKTPSLQGGAAAWKTKDGGDGIDSHHA